jgi:hypothetical protein
MKSLRHATCQLIFALVCYGSATGFPDSGFCLPDSVNEMILPLRTIRNLIVLPVMINDSIQVNLILDTGCRNLVLFGKRFQKLFQLQSGREIEFSGLGSGKPVRGYLSLSNKVSIHEVLGEHIPIVVVPNKNVMSMYHNIHGVIGFEIFFKFEIELNPETKTITFRPAMRTSAPMGFSRVPLRIVDCRPVIYSNVYINANQHRKYDLMIDTGSSLGLLLKTPDANEFDRFSQQRVLGHGFNGPVYGYTTKTDMLDLDGFKMAELETGVIETPWNKYASIGMEVLKDYVVVINYYRSYACFKRLESA